MEIKQETLTKVSETMVEINKTLAGLENAFVEMMCTARDTNKKLVETYNALAEEVKAAQAAEKTEG